MHLKPCAAWNTVFDLRIFRILFFCRISSIVVSELKTCWVLFVSLHIDNDQGFLGILPPRLVWFSWCAWTLGGPSSYCNCSCVRSFAGRQWFASDCCLSFDIPSALSCRWWRRRWRSLRGNRPESTCVSSRTGRCPHPCLETPQSWGCVAAVAAFFYDCSLPVSKSWRAGWRKPVWKRKGKSIEKKLQFRQKCIQAYKNLSVNTGRKGNKDFN